MERIIILCGTMSFLFLVIFLFSRAIWRSDRRKEFKAMFLFSPENTIRNQAVVDGILALYVRKFALVATKQTEVLKYIKEMRKSSVSDETILKNLQIKMQDFFSRRESEIMMFVLDYRTIDGFILYFKEEVDRCKSYFWHAHSLAKEFGYTVEERIFDYDRKEKVESFRQINRELIPRYAK